VHSICNCEEGGGEGREWLLGGEELLGGGFHTRGVVFPNFKTWVLKIIVQVHALYHAPDQAAMIVDDLILQMKKCIQANPMLPVGMTSFL
jgi:hypothetical protein